MGGYFWTGVRFPTAPPFIHSYEFTKALIDCDKIIKQ